jgi:hypothetical protein
LGKDRLPKRGYYLISGYKQPELPGRDRQVYHIYKELRKGNIKPKDMGLEGKSHNTMENVIYSLEKIKKLAIKKGQKGPIRVGVVSYPGHLSRFEDFQKKAIKKGLIKKGEFEFERIETPESDEKKSYEGNFLRKLKHWYLLKTMGKYKIEE